MSPLAHRATSTAPIVQLPSLATPRWSVRGQTWTPFSVVPVGMAPIAGLPVAGRMVWVGPPLFWSPEGPRPAGVSEWLVPAVRPQVPSSSRLYPPSTTELMIPDNAQS